MLHVDALFLGAHDFDVEADPFAVVAETVLVEDADLVQGAARIDGAEGEVLVEFQTVLVVQVHAPQFLVRQREAHFIGGRKVGEQGMRGFDQAADAFRRIGHQTHGDRVTDGRDVGVVHRFIGLGFDHDADVFVVVEHGLDRGSDAFGGDHRVFGFADIGAFAGEPQHDIPGAERSGDIDGAFGAFDRVFTAFRAVVGVTAVDGLRCKPHAGRHKFGRQSMVVQDFLQRGRFLDDFGRRKIGHVRNGIVVMELNAVETHFLVGFELLVERNGAAHFRTERVGSLMNVPRTE